LLLVAVVLLPVYGLAHRKPTAWVLHPSELRTPDGRLVHTWKAGVAKGDGFLEDYAHLIEGLLELYQTAFDPRWYVAAHELADGDRALLRGGGVL
jgi:uncharacterized protein YyaL (SSP411 family)